MVIQKTQVAISTKLLNDAKKNMLASSRVLIESLLESVANKSIVYIDGCRCSTQQLISNGLIKTQQKESKLEEELKPEEEMEEEPQEEIVKPERANKDVFVKGQNRNIKKPTAISGDLKLCRKELKSSCGTDRYDDVVFGIMRFKYPDRTDGDELYTYTPDMQEESLYNFFKRNKLPHLADQIDSLINDIITKRYETQEDSNADDEEELSYAD